jgi:hypothetical protein
VEKLANELLSSIPKTNDKDEKVLLFLGANILKAFRGLPSEDRQLMLEEVACALDTGTPEGEFFGWLAWRLEGVDHVEYDGEKPYCTEHLDEILAAV